MKSSLFFASALGFCLQACGLNSATPLNAVAEKLAHAPKVLATNEWGTLSFLPEAEGEEGREGAVYEIEVPFERLFADTGDLAKFGLPRVGDSIGVILKEDLYMPDETPAGGPREERGRPLFQIPLPGYLGLVETQQGSKFLEVEKSAVSAFILPSNLSESYQEFSLDTNREETRAVSKMFGRDLSLRVDASGSEAKISACVVLPGANVTSTEVRRVAKLSEPPVEETGLRFAGTATPPRPAPAEVDSLELIESFGAFSTRYSRGCSKQVLFRDTGAGRFVKPEREIADFDATLLPGESKSVHKQFLGLSEEEIPALLQSGEFYAKVFFEPLLKAAVDISSRASQTALARFSLPQNSEELKVVLLDQCRLRKFADGETTSDESLAEKVRAFCRDFAESLEVSEFKLTVIESERAKGCFTNFGRIAGRHARDGRGKWWTSGCHLRASFRITGPPKARPDEKVAESRELIELLKTFVLRGPVPLAWMKSEEFRGWVELTLLLQEWEKAGNWRIRQEDWKWGLHDLRPEVEAAAKL